MSMVNVQQTMESTDAAEEEFYQLIEEGYRALQDGRVRTVDEVRERIKIRRGERE